MRVRVLLGVPFKQRIKHETNRLQDIRMVFRERGVFKGKKDLKCMTSACAIGYTAHLFAKQGFKLKIHPDVNNALIPVYKKLSQFGAVAAFFDITFHEANYLFNAKDYPNEDENGSFAAISVGQVADRIENFIHGIKE